MSEQAESIVSFDDALTVAEELAASAKTRFVAVGRHRIYECDGRHVLWTEGVGCWGFDLTLDGAKRIAAQVE